MWYTIMVWFLATWLISASAALAFIALFVVHLLYPDKRRS